MKFNWKVEDMYLMNHEGHVIIGKYRPFPIESELTREEKIEVVDSRSDGMLSYLLDLFKKFKTDEPNMKRDQWGGIMTVTLKGWIKRNDPRHAIDDSYNYGKVRPFRTERYIQNIEHKGPYDHLDDFVDEVFHRELHRMYDEEVAYFKTVDPYEVAKKTLRDNVDQYRTTFGVGLCFSSSCEITINDGTGARYQPPITLEQCNYLNSKFDNLKKIIESMKNDIAIAMANADFTFNSDDGGEVDGSETAK